MSKSAALFTLLIAALSGLIASYSVSNYIRSIEAQTARGLEEQAWVVYAKTEIAAGSRIQTGMLGKKRIDREDLPQGAFSEPAVLADRVPVTSLYPGEMIIENRLADPGSPAGLPALIPTGGRAITLKVDDTIGVGGFIKPGSRIDVVTIVDTGESTRRLVSKVILQNVLVIATGSEMDPKDEKKAKVVPTVTVLVSLEQAEQLSLATSAGSIRLVLRNQADQAEEITAGVTLANLIPQVKQEEQRLPLPTSVYIEEPLPAKKVRVVEVYRGSERSEVTFEQ